MLNALYGWLLYGVCRHGTQWRGVWRLDLLGRVRRFRFPARGTMCVQTKWGLPMEVRKHDFVGRILYFFGDFERKLLDAAQRELRPGSSALDIGANIGAVTLYLGSLVGPTGRVFSVEPLGENFALLQRNVQGVGFGDRIRTEHGALGPEGIVTLYFDEQSDNWGEVSLLAPPVGAAEQVPMFRLDTLWKQWSRPCFDFVKMDVEGYEYDVLQGAAEMLLEAPPKVWVVEFNMEYLNRIENGALRLWDFFRQHRYEPYSMVTHEKLLQPPDTHCDVLFRLGGSTTK